MATLTIPEVFVPGLASDDDTMNTNFTTIRTHVNAELVNRDASVAFTNPPTVPAVDATTANQLVRKAQIDAACAASYDVMCGGVWRRVANQSMALGANLMTVDTEDSDSDGFWSSGTTFTVPTGKGGVYEVSGWISGSPTPSHAYIVVGGVTYYGPTTSVGTISLQTSVVTVAVPLAQAATIQLGVYNGGVGADNYTGFMRIRRVSL